MAATATDNQTKTKSVDEQIAELAKLGASLQEAVEQINAPQYSAGRAGDGTVSYWEQGATKTYGVPTGRDGNLLPAPYRSIPKGYKHGVFKTFGEFIKEGYAAHKSGSVGDFSNKFQSAFKAIQGLSSTEGAGGFFIMPEFNMSVLERVYQNDIWGRTDQYTVNNNMIFLANAETSRATRSRHGGLRGFWVDQGASHTKSKPAMRQISMSLKKASVLVYLTEELLADGGAALEQYVSRKVNEEFNFMMGDVVFNGSGVQQPLGIYNSPALLSITKEGGQSAATIVAANIDKMWARRHAGGANYAWFHNQDCGPQLDNLAQIIGTSGISLYRPQDGIASAAPQILKTAPRVETEFNSTLGTVGDICLADMKQYLTISKGGITQAYDTSIEFLTDQVALKFTIRVNGRPWDTSPVTPFKGSNTQASFLVVETRA